MIYQRGFCATCGQPLSVTEKLKNLTSHMVCPSNRPSAEVTAGLAAGSEAAAPPIGGAGDALRDEEPWQRPSASSRSEASNEAWSAPPVRPVSATPVAGQTRYRGATLVSLFFWWAGWIAGVLGTLGAIVAASANYCSSNLFNGSDCSGQSEARIVMFFAVLLGSWFYACLMFWLAYMLRLQADMEMEVRQTR